MPELDTDLYRRMNADLANLSDNELRRHFEAHGRREKRIFARVEETSSQTSMRWLRGNGLEIGAGRYKLRLFGQTSCTYADVQGSEYFGNETKTFDYSLNNDVPTERAGKFDFVACSHVLEHVDSLILSLRRLKAFVRPGGIIYFIVPDKRYLDDQHWMPDFDLRHHLAEEKDPLGYADMHDKICFDRMYSQRHTLDGRSGEIGGQAQVDQLRQVIANGSLGEQRFAFHKHTYSFDGWLKIMLPIIEHVEGLTIEEVRLGYERCDCHFVLEKK